MTRAGLGLGALVAVWLTQAALRGRAAQTLTQGQTLAVLLVVACIVTLIVGVVAMCRRPPVRKAPRR